MAGSSVSLQVLGEGDSSIVGPHKRSCACRSFRNPFQVPSSQKIQLGLRKGGEKKKRKFVQIHLAGVQTRWEMLAMGRCCKQAFIHQADMGNVNPAHFRGCCLILWWGFGEQFLGSLWKSNLLGVHVWSTSSLHQAGIPALASMGRDGLLANVPSSMCILHQ